LQEYTWRGRDPPSALRLAPLQLSITKRARARARAIIEIRLQRAPGNLRGARPKR